MRALMTSILTCALAACGGGSGSTANETTPVTTAPAPIPQAQHARGAREASATFTSLGGSLSLSNGARLEIPAGAFDQPTEVVFSVGADTQAFSNREDDRPIGPTLQIAPPLTPAVALVLSASFAGTPSGFSAEHAAIAIEESDNQRALSMGGQQTRWQYGAATIEGNRVSAQLAQVEGLRIQFLVSR